MSETPETPPQRSQPGQILKRAREAKNLSVAAIATQMNLDLRIVEALEAGDDARLPAPIFVRGYLRGYARLVEVPESAVLEAYQAQAPQEPVPRAVGMASAPLRPALRRSALPWRGVLLTALLIGAGALGLLVGPQLLQQVREALPVADGPAPDTVPQTAPGAGLSLPAPPASEPTQTPPAAPAPDGGALALPLPPPAPSEEREAPAMQAVPGAEPALPAEEDFAASGDAALPATPPAAPADAAPQTAAPQTAAPAASPQSPAPEAPASAPAASAGPRLTFRFTGQSWVEVRDANGNKLLFGLYGGGETREVSGKPPVSVLLGNAAGVELRVNGAPFDVVARSSDNIARFRIEAGN